MSDQVTTFEFYSNKIRTNFINNELWFCVIDICKVLGFGNPRQALLSHTFEDDVQKMDTIDNLNRKQKLNFVNESGLYCLIFGSKLDTAKEFKRWVTLAF